jgi:AraC family transcriptional regulator
MLLIGVSGPRQIVVPLAGRAGTHRGLPPGALQRVFQYIDMHLDERLSIRVLANTVGLSPCYFAHAFKQSTGLSPHDYLVQRRVQRVEELLSETDMPISEIALAVGFADQSHCCRRFRERVGLTPSEYRWSMR